MYSKTISEGDLVSSCVYPIGMDLKMYSEYVKELFSSVAMKIPKASEFTYELSLDAQAEYPPELVGTPADMEQYGPHKLMLLVARPIVT